MIVYSDFVPGCRNDDSPTVLTLGTFDGVHVGHRSILGRVLELSRERNETAAVMTFDRHPLTVLRPEDAPRLLTTLDEKRSVFEQLGFDEVYIVPFTTSIANMDAGVFIGEYLVQGARIAHLVVGYDHRFGKDRTLDDRGLAGMGGQFGFTIERVAPVSLDGTIVRSSLIRDNLLQGQVETAARLLGDTYSLTGTVVRGRGVASTIGFPTANVRPDSMDKLIPGDGVYAGWVVLGDGQRHPAAVTVGSSPTLGFADRVIEAHIPGFSGDLYETQISIGFTHRLRDIMRFDSREVLIEHIKNDINATLNSIRTT